MTGWVKIISDSIPQSHPAAPASPFIFITFLRSVSEWVSELPWTLLAGLLSYSFQAILQQQAHKCLELHWEITSKFFWNIMNGINVHLSPSKIQWIYHCYNPRITMNKNNMGWISWQVKNLNCSLNVRLLYSKAVNTTYTDWLCVSTTNAMSTGRRAFN